MEKIKINKKGMRWYRSKHPWIYRDDCLSKPSRELSGKIVSVFSENDEFLGKAFCSVNSKIALRFITRSDEEIGRDFWCSRIKNAVAYRKTVVSGTNAFRLIFSESDFIPGLIVDIYGNNIVMQTLIPGTENLIGVFRDILIEELKPTSVILRNDASVRSLEGLEEKKEVLFGEKPEAVEVFEADVKYFVDLWEGHKTGSYLDQRENRIFVSGLKGKKALDLFSYQGNFALHLAKGFSNVLAVESSKSAVAKLEKNLELNGIKNVKVVNENVFDIIKDYSKNEDKFDLIILDPPAFAKSKRELMGAGRGYKELNLRAIQALNKGGILVTCSCSYNVSENDFSGMIRDAAADAKKDLVLIEKRIQSADHPILLTFPESFYLKCLVFKVVN